MSQSQSLDFLGLLFEVDEAEAQEELETITEAENEAYTVQETK